MIIIKIGGGKEIKDNLDNILKSISQKKEKIIIVHGANAEMREISEKLDNPEKIVTSPSGFTSRFTDRATLEIFMMVYAGVANKRIVEKLQSLGVNAIGLSGVDGRLLVGNRKPHVKIIENNKVKLLRGNYTGTVEEVNSGLLNSLLDAGMTPVIAPPAISYDGEAINVDNDRIVGALCKAMPVDTIISLFEAPGLLKDASDDSTVIRRINKDNIDTYMQFAQGRMKKKIHHAKEAFDNGVKRIIFSDGRLEDPLASEGTIIE